MTDQSTAIAPVQPRARGDVRAQFDRKGGATRLDRLRQAGSSRALFPRNTGRSLQMVLTNTSGGVTGGDRFRTEVSVEEGAKITVTTQAAERAYRAQPGQTGRVDTRLRIGAESRLNWLPQETILFDGCDFTRRLRVDIATGAEALVVEPVVFGRAAMGEEISRGRFDDRIEIRQNETLCFLDRTLLEGDLSAHLRRSAIGDGAGAAALIVFASLKAEAALDQIRALLPETGGVSLLSQDLLVARLLAVDGFALRHSLLPMIAALTRDEIPRPWMI